MPNSAGLLGKVSNAQSKLKNFAIDMRNSYSSLLKEDWSDCKIIYDHFHVIKVYE